MVDGALSHPPERQFVVSFRDLEDGSVFSAGLTTIRSTR